MEITVRSAIQSGLYKLKVLRTLVLAGNAIFVSGGIGYKRRRMAGPKLQIEERMDRVELAIRTIAGWSEQTPTASGELRNVEAIEQILSGENLKEPEEDASQEE